MHLIESGIIRNSGHVLLERIHPQMLISDCVEEASEQEASSQGDQGELGHEFKGSISN